MHFSRFKKAGLVALSCVFALGLVACGDDAGAAGRTRIKFIASGEAIEYKTLQSIVSEYNGTQGATDGVWVDIAYKPSSDYSTYLTTTYTGKDAPDVFYADDRYFKYYVRMGFVSDLDELQETTGITLDTSEMYSSGISRYRYDVNTNTSNDDDPLYGVVRGLSPTIIYYNATAFSQVGITCVSVDEADITDDYTAQFNRDHGTSFTAAHLKRGFVRQSVVDNYDGTYQNIAYAWSNPYEGEVMVFNNRIAMSWDEVEDLGKILTNTYNNAAPTEYGYYTWWWFYYGFSVGGDCIEDVTGNGDWVFTLKDNVPNFMVADDFEGSVTVGEHTYSAGELLTYTDRTVLTEETKQRLLKSSSDLDESYLTEQVKELEKAGTLIRLPSERDAFVRFVNLAQEKGTSDQYGAGLGISPIPKNTSITGDTGQFTGGKVAMLVHKSNSLLSIEETISKSTKSFSWNVAPLPQYKIYGEDGSVTAHGVQGGASDSSAFCINSYSSKKEASMYFLKYLCSKEAQDYAAATGFTLPSRPDCAEAYLNSPVKDYNLKIIAEAAFYETPGDWWYMPDKTWIDNYWANDLNNSVRNNTMTLETFFSKFEASQQALNQYKLS